MILVKCSITFFLLILYLCPLSWAEELKLTGKHSKIFERAVALEKEGKTTDAAAEYRLYLKKNKDIVPAYFYLGNLYWNAGFRDKAMETYREAAKACPT
jgi:tetratricopeptide (TPR) repeat protein